MLVVSDEVRAIKNCFFDDENDAVIEGYFPQINVNDQWVYIWDKHSPIEKICVASRKEALRIASDVIETRKNLKL